VIGIRCATSWYQVCRKFLLGTVFIYHIYCVKFIICHTKFFIVNGLFASHMYAVGYDVYYDPPFILIELNSVGCKRELINLNQYNLRVCI